MILSICSIFFLGHGYAQTKTVDGAVHLDSLQNHYLQKMDSIAVVDSLSKKVDIGKDSINSFVNKIKKYNMEKLVPGTVLKDKKNIPDVNIPIKAGDLPRLKIPSDGLNQKIWDNLLPEDVTGNIGSQTADHFPIEELNMYKERADGYKGKFSGYKGGLDTVLTSDGSQVDTMLMDLGMEQAEKWDGKFFTQEELNGLGEEADMKKAFTSTLEEEGGIPAKGDLEKLDYKKLQKDHFSETGALKEGMGAIQRIKSKYKEIQDSRNPGEGTKRNSLKDRSFFQRWEIGIYGNIPSIDPLELGLDLAMEYRVERRWTVGGGPIIMGKIGRRNGRDKSPGALSWEGYRTYSLFKIKGDVFLQAEYQRKNPAITEGDLSIKKLNVFLGGLGTEFKLMGNFRVRSTVLYSINKKEILKGGFQSHWHVSMGIVHFRK